MLLKSQWILSEHSHSTDIEENTNQTKSYQIKSNFGERGKLEDLGKNLLEQSREPRNPHTACNAESNQCT